MVTLENEHYLRTILLLCEGGAYIAKQIIGQELPNYGGDLDELLKQCKNKLKHEFHIKQMEKLFPNNGYDKTNVNKWDIQMLIGVMLFLFRKSLRDEEKQKLREIKLIRHEVLAHSPSASLYIEKYEDTQKQLGDAINTLADGFDQTIKDKCKEYLKTYASEPLEVKSAIKRLQKAKDNDDLFEEVINVIRKSQETLSKEIHKAESNLTQVMKSAEQNISKGVKSVELKISLELNDSTKAISKELSDIEINVKDSKQKISKEISLVEGSVRFTKEALIKEIDEIKSSDCNTFKALMDVNNQIKNLQAWLMQYMTQGSHDGSPTDLQHISEDLRMKSVEIDKQILTYDSDSLQPFASGAITKEKKEKHSGIFQYQQTKPDKLKLMVVAFDFGTTYSGYAFSFCDDQLKINTRQFSGPCALLSSKAPTAVLFDARKRFHSFGYEAEDKYYELAAENEHRDWYFFRRFKMKLYTEKVNRNTKLKAENGEEMMAKDVFEAVIRHFKDHLMGLLQERRLDYIQVNADIHWILTVPAIWTDQAKQFMREAANKAGIENGNLSIALEPEAASMYCQAIDLKRDRRFATIHGGTKYMVLDLGGGTVDITVHEKQNDGRQKELFKATG